MGASAGAGVRTERAADGRRLRVVLDGPRGHVITDRAVGAMREALRTVPDQPSLRLVTLEADGPDFSFGSSIEEHTPATIGAVLPRFHDLVREWLAVPCATAALVQGRCLGGGFELALCCDVIFAADDADLGLPEIALGVFPPAGAVLLPARIGTARATTAVLTGESRPAAAWQAAGLVERTAPAGALGTMVDEWYARHLSGRSATALGHAARAARLALADTVARLLPESERRYLRELMQAPDAAEGIAAFLARRPPNWSA
ncbi:MAG: enoyl-CoA hydratase/isomerase family protein [Acidobacteriota bacterium]|nr:enoyl-CoA hydratase/isomerase family protein [Acidobacteriota bacterium]